MILGIGTDLCDIRRIEKSLERFGDRFTARLYTDAERSKASARANPAQTFATCFAAKEAFAKALGTGFSDGIGWRDVGVENLSSGQPVLKVTGAAKVKLEALVPGGMQAKVHVSLTDEYPMAQAFVVIDAIV